jgi:hypothetical protein
LVGWLAGLVGLIDWLVGWFGCLIDWLVGWFGWLVCFYCLSDGCLLIQII